ncbi:MAG: hypothetical protein N2045_13345 [Fimbriimonadales bacterium]|jgi:lipopolysaccharide export system protein LptC|nr:hypothetical protein [Fimbriimonadales bacterium]CUU10051.1 hypothetical protein GBSOP10_106323 [Armatimonadetes bacterium GBS]CUU34763.1 hypothetical protein GXSOP10_11843 [Armatimonadetes bacterium GXS]CUU35254.1 hypothetical protein DCOP10_114102 [Armatimonadetes bacterium DC]GBC90766.1 hypothetical protein HRbin14_01520 [bacterium HR14]
MQDSRRTVWIVLLVIALIAIGVAIFLRQQATAPPAPSAEGYYSGPMKGKGSSGGSNAAGF